MAIIANEIDERGYVFENQYIRVDRVDASKEEGSMRVLIGVYQSQQVAEEGGNPHRADFITGGFDLYATDNVWQQAYVAVKERYPTHTDA